MRHSVISNRVDFMREEEIILIYTSKRQKKFDDIYSQYSDRIYKICFYMLKDEDAALDMMQQAFLNFYKHFDNVNPDCMFAYLVRAAKNTVLNYLRVCKREIVTAEIYEIYFRDELTRPSVEEEYFHSERQRLECELGRKIMRELRIKNEAYYQIYKKLYYDDKTHYQISKEMGFSKEVLYSRIYRAKLWIRKRYTEEYQKILDMT